MRLIVARCEVRYSGRLSAVLPEALRPLMIKSDGSVMVHSDAGGYKPENWSGHLGHSLVSPRCGRCSEVLTTKCTRSLVRSAGCTTVPFTSTGNPCGS
jgi:RecB family endonuclease NucS